MQLDVVGPGTVTSKSSRLKLMEFCFFQLVCLSSSKHNNPHIACSTDSNMRYRMVVRLILQPGMLVSQKKTWKNSLIYLDWWTERAMFLQSCQLCLWSCKLLHVSGAVWEKSLGLFVSYPQSYVLCGWVWLSAFCCGLSSRSLPILACLLVSVWLCVCGCVWGGIRQELYCHLVATKPLPFLWGQGDQEKEMHGKQWCGVLSKHCSYTSLMCLCGGWCWYFINGSPY